MTVDIRMLASAQRKRAVAGILTLAEDVFADRLSDEEWEEFRGQVMSSIGNYHDFILDVLKVSRDDSLRNEEAVRLIRAVHDSQLRLERSMVD